MGLRGTGPCQRPGPCAAGSRRRVSIPRQFNAARAAVPRRAAGNYHLWPFLCKLLTHNVPYLNPNRCSGLRVRCSAASPYVQVNDRQRLLSFKYIFPNTAPSAAYPFFSQNQNFFKYEILCLNTSDDVLGLGCVGHSKSSSMSLNGSESRFISSSRLRE